MVFIERLNSLLQEKHLTRKQFLDDLHFGKNQITYWEKNQTIPNQSTLDTIAGYFNVSVDYLLGRTDQKEKPSEEGEDVVVVSRNGERFVHHLNPDQIKLLEDMIKQFGGDN